MLRRGSTSATAAPTNAPSARTSATASPQSRSSRYPSTTSAQTWLASAPLSPRIDDSPQARSLLPPLSEVFHHAPQKRDQRPPAREVLAVSCEAGVARDRGRTSPRSRSPKRGRGSPWTTSDPNSSSVTRRTSMRSAVRSISRSTSGASIVCDPQAQRAYVSEVSRLLKPGGTHVMWALDSAPSDIRLSPTAVKEIFAPGFELQNARKSRRRLARSHWYWLVRSSS